MIAVLLSGGIDSLCCLRWAIRMYGKDSVRAFFFDYGQPYVERELAATRRITQALGIRLWHPVLPLSVHADGHVPLRNLAFLFELAKMEQYSGVVFGMLKGEASEDKNPRFIRRVQTLLDSQFKASIYREKKREFRIITPFADCTKAEMLKWHIQTCGAEYVHDTVACYSEEGNCGECMSCFNRYVAFQCAGLVQEEYRVHPVEWMLKQRRHERIDWRLMWARRRWLWEVYTVVRSYLKQFPDRSLIRELLG